MNRPYSPNQADVARIAGVSQATVSAVINGQADGRRIPAKTRDRVLRVASELGYVPNVAARSLRGRQNHLVGVYTFESVFPVDSHDYYYEFLLGIEEEAEVRGYDLVLFSSTHDEDGRRHIYRDGSNRLRLADGSILLGLHQDSDELVRLIREKYPFIHIGRRFIPGHDIAYVSADYRSAVAEVVGDLIARGHTRIVYVGSRIAREPQQDRRDGYRDALAKHQLSPPFRKLITIEQIDPDFLASAVKRGTTSFLLESARDATALAAAAHQNGIRIPEDLSAVVLSDTRGGPDPTRRWSTVGSPRRQLGRMALQLLIDLLAGAPISACQRAMPCVPPSGDTIAPVAVEPYILNLRDIEPVGEGQGPRSGRRDQAPRRSC